MATPSVDAVLVESLFAFIASFLIAPFSVIGYLFVLTLVIVEVFAHVRSDTPLLSARLFIIISTVLGRWIGELFWPFVIMKGRSAL